MKKHMLDRYPCLKYVMLCAFWLFRAIKCQVSSDVNEHILMILITLAEKGGSVLWVYTVEIHLLNITFVS